MKAKQREWFSETKLLIVHSIIAVERLLAQSSANFVCVVMNFYRNQRLQDNKCLLKVVVSLELSSKELFVVRDCCLLLTGYE